ncbi:MAG: sigma-70 family RNA polymerase sigma factor [Candidatus Shapirobacteria bacterium]
MAKEIWEYYNGIKAFIGRKIDDEGTVEEITNDVMWAAIKSRDSFAKKSAEFSWICGIAKHKIIDYYRKKKLKTILFSINPKFEEIADEALSPERDILKNELKNEIKATFDEISEGYANILRLKYVTGLKTNAIAILMKTTIKAVEGQLKRAKIKFRENWNYDRQKNKKFVEIRNTDRD